MIDKKNNLLSGITLAGLLALPLGACATSGAAAKDAAPVEAAASEVSSETSAVTAGDQATDAGDEVVEDKGAEMACGEGQCGAAPDGE